MARKKGLGRGLDILIPKETNTQAEEAKDTSAEAAVKKKEKAKKDDQMININLIEPNRDQPRKQFDEEAIDELADSIKKHGLINPVIVKKNNDYYEIIAGERRWRAAKKAGLKEIPVIVRDCDEQELAELSLIENLQREDLNPIEEALAYQTLIETYNLKQDDIAERVFKSRTVITNALRLLKLDPKVQEMLIEGVISTGHAKVILGLENKEDQILLAERVADEQLSVRETEKIIKQMQNRKEKPEKVKLGNGSLYESIENKMKMKIGTMVRIRRKGENSGKIEIEYYSSDDLDRIMERMGINE